MAQKTRTILLRQGDEDAELQVQLPVNPKKIVIYQPQNTISYQTIRGETIHAACGTGLTEVTLETFLPGEDSRFYQGTAPEKALQLLTRWKENGTPVRLLISGSGVDGLFLICELRQTLTEGDRDLGIGMDLREYKPILMAEAEHTAEETAGGLAEREDPRTVPPVYVTEQEEELWQIAKRFLGDGSLWKEIALKNGITDPHCLPEGKEIRLG